MATSKLYLGDSTLLQDAATVRDFGVTENGRAWVRLDKTIFHAQGGGQKADRGAIGERRVLHVAHAADDEVDHFVDLAEGFEVGQRVELRVDADWRHINACHHTGGHLIAALVEAHYPNLKAIAGHHWPDEARVEFDGEPKPDVEQLESQLKQDIASVINAALPIHVVGDPFTDRYIQIGGYSPVPCGGTHLQQIAELAEVCITRIRIKSGKIRVSYSAM